MSNELTFRTASARSAREPTEMSGRDAHVRTRTNYWAILVAAAAALVASSVWYTLFGPVWLALRGMDASTHVTPHAWEIAGQLLRNLVVALALATLLKRLGVTTRVGALRLGALVWVGFQAMAIVGGVLHENYPPGLYAIHAGDALMTTLIMAFIIGGWRHEERIEEGVQP
jgi:Protein of unknown function (DUF1761)